MFGYKRKLMKKVRILYTEGKGEFKQGEFELPNITSSQIRVKSRLTGICRSDIDMMNGTFGPLPLSMQGHEGLGEVLEVGENIKDIQVGNIVATRGEPAYADEYNADEGTYVVVPKVDPKYIVEPVACGLNVVMQEEFQFVNRNTPGAKLCIIGSGFLSYVVYQYLIMNYSFDIDVIGSSNEKIWGDKLKKQIDSQYDIVIDLNTRSEIFDQDIIKPQGLIVLGAEKTQGITTKFSNLLWKAVTVVFPSPRQKNFVNCMKMAVKMIDSHALMSVDKFWSKGYNRTTEWQDAFKESNLRMPGYNRGYLEWL
jgi:D-arabinose 1-dehydrogenase-like Zn-dependent alcohol dehydrogenase